MISRVGQRIRNGQTINGLGVRGESGCLEGFGGGRGVGCGREWREKGE